MFREIYRSINEQISPNQELIDKIINLTNEPQKKARKSKSIFFKPVLITAVIIVCMITAMPTLAANVPAIYQLMYMVSPAVAQFFIPVQESCENNGIRMEVVSAYIHDNTVEIYITMQDLTGNRIDGTIDLYDSYSIHRSFDSAATCNLIGYDEAAKTATFLISITEWDNEKIVGDKITFSVREFLSDKHEYNDIPITVDLTDIDNNPQTKQTSIIGSSGTIFKDYNHKVEVLVTSTPMDFPVEGILFTGIGYVNGMLHIQTSTANTLKNDNHAYFFFKSKDGNDIYCDYSVAFAENMESDKRVDYDEYVFDIPPSEINDYSLYGTFVTTGLFTEGNWQVTFPLVDAINE